MWLLLAACTAFLLKPPRRHRAVVPVLLVAALAVALAQTVVVPALPLFQRRYDVSQPGAAWLLTAFMLASAVVTPVAGRLGDLLGHRRVMAVCLACLVAGGALAAYADHASWYAGTLAGRALQGCAGGVFPSAFGLARAETPPPKLGGVIAALSAMFGVGGALGIAVAGPVVDAAGTTWLFVGLAGVAGAALVGVVGTGGGGGAATAGKAVESRGAAQGGEATAAGVQKSGSRSKSRSRSRSVRPLRRHPVAPHPSPPKPGLDLPGALLLAVALVALLLGVTQGRTWGWSSVRTLGLFGGAVLLAVCFLVVELRSPAPLVDPRLLRGRARAGTHLATLVISVAMFSAATLVPQFAQTPTSSGYGFGASPAGTGLLLVPMALCMVLAAPLSARLAARRDIRTAFRTGAALAAVTLTALGLRPGGLTSFAVAGALLGLAYGFAFASLGGLVVGSVPAEQTGAATGVNTILRTVGGAIGAQLAAALVTASATPATGGTPTESGYTTAFLASAIAAVGALGVSYVLPGAGKRASARVRKADAGS